MSPAWHVRTTIYFTNVTPEQQSCPAWLGQVGRTRGQTWIVSKHNFPKRYSVISHDYLSQFLISLSKMVNVDWMKVPEDLKSRLCYLGGNKEKCHIPQGSSRVAGSDKSLDPQTFSYPHTSSPSPLIPCWPSSALYKWHPSRFTTKTM
jgi:hypothetical protein